MGRQAAIIARPALFLSAWVLAATLLAPTPLEAGLFKRSKPAAAAAPKIEPVLRDIDQALAEDRLVDAGRLIDTALATGVADKSLLLRAGELHLARGRFEEAIRTFGDAEGAAGTEPLALQGKGIALSRLGRSEEAVKALKAAVAADPRLWRAWNALAVEADRRHDWTGAEAAYAEALKSPEVTASVFNNRGYSRLLQARYAEASEDFVRALEKDPAFAVARTNLRLSMALRGDYGRATAVSGVEDRASVLNNAGFAAVLRGDLAEAENLFQQAVDAKGTSYARALENLQMVKALIQAKSDGPATP